MEAIIASIISVLVAIGGVVYKTTLNKMVGSFFSGKSDKEIRRMSIYILIAVVFVMNIPLILESNDGNGGKALPIALTEKEEVEDEKSEVEIYAELTKEGVGIASEAVQQMKENKQRKEEAILANKAKLWVYQIGIPTSDKNELWRKYKKLETLGNIAVFRKDKRTMFLIKDDGKTEQELKNNLDEFKSNISNIDSRVSVINLMSKCKLKEKIIGTKDIKVKRKTFMKCRVCD